MSTATETVIKEDSTLTNRFHRSGYKRNSPSSAISQMEEMLIEKLDYFVSSIEIKLDHFDSYFKTKRQENNKLAGHSRSRRGSTSSLVSFRDVSVLKLNLVQERLRLIKQSVLSKGLENLDYLYALLDDQYNYLFSSTSSAIDIESDDDNDNDNGKNDSTKEPKEPPESNREILSKKIINTISYFDAKLVKIDDYIKERTPSADFDLDTNDAIYNKLRFFNFNRALKNANENPSGLIHYYELPLSWRENKYIIEGYRFSLKHSQMLKSVFHWHNETMNIWSHLAGLGVVLYLALVNFPQSSAFHKNTWGDNLAMYQFLAAAMVCLVSSSVWHTYSCFAHYPMRKNFACIDYTGITILITCSIIAVEYCALYNHPNLLWLYMGFSLAMGLFGFFFNWSSYFDRPECRSLRIGFFIGLSACGATAVLCKAYYDGVFAALKFFIPLTYKSFVWYLLGVVFYGGLIPERWRYDVIIENNLEANTCQHHYGIEDVLEDRVGHAGREELEELELELRDLRQESHLHHHHHHNETGAPAIAVEEDVNEAAAAVDAEAGSALASSSSSHRRSSSMCLSEMDNDDILHQLDEIDNSNSNNDDDPDKSFLIEDEDEREFRELVNKHFRNEPIKTPYANDFRSLWWVDYALQSHNIWHVCVVLGVVGHYFVVKSMFDDLQT
ncbi:uncharacterized protein LODBEIA_P40580 [Lodderomyces beijingensis]|uniref:ADIPOR-like receptor IZH3 n=1 Tax=Lodderomyces beijingensis TaxID=1775926 RepID=A0ABP0ZNW0_9ASCO